MSRPAKPLKKLLLKAKVRPGVVSDCTKLIDSEVGKKGGLTGIAIKSGYKVMKNLKSGQMIPQAVDWLLDEFVDKMEPTVAAFIKNGGDVSDKEALIKCFMADQELLADALLEVTDEKAQKAKNSVIISAYNKLRPLARKEVKAALPGVAAVIADTAEKK